MNDELGVAELFYGPDATREYLKALVDKHEPAEEEQQRISGQVTTESEADD